MINVDNKIENNNNININIIKNNNVFLSENKENMNEIKAYNNHKDKNITKKKYIYLSKDKFNSNYHLNNNNINNSKDNKKSKKKRRISKKDEANLINCHNKTNIKKYKHNKSQSQNIHNLNSISESDKKRNKNLYYTDYQSKNYSFNKDKDKSSCGLEEHNSFSIQRKKKYEYNPENLKLILINKMNNQIEEILKGKQKIYCNEKKNLFFLGFCDFLFDLGFIHIKETEIVDISKIEQHINDLYTQPFTNRDLLSESFLFNEQILLISAWKTILHNFHLVKDFKYLPNESEEITLDDFKLFVFIVTGLFIGYNEKKSINEECKDDKSNIELDKKKINNLKNISLIPRGKHTNGKIKKKILENSNVYNNDNNYSFTYINNNSSSPKKDTYFCKKRNSKDKNNCNFLNNKENLLKKILENKNKSTFYFKNILKIKNHFKYFAELRKLYNLYKKDLKNINKKINIEKEYTFYPKTNKNNNKLLNKIPPTMNFFERSALIKVINEQKIKKLEFERTKELLKECTFEPCYKINQKVNKNPLEISNRLYYNNSNRKTTDPELKNHSKNNSNTKTNKNKKEENINTKIFYKPKIKSINLKNYNMNNIKNNKNIISNNININNSLSHYINTSYKKSNRTKFDSNIDENKYSYSPDINKNFNKEMFSHSPLANDLLLKNRINCLRNINFKKNVDNYEKNNREILSNSIKKNKKILKEIIREEKGYKKLDIEKKTNKDTFDNFKNYNNYNYKKNDEPLFFVEIKIKDKIKIIEFYQDDKPEIIVYNFCVQNSLGESSYDKILMVIKDKLEEIKRGIYDKNTLNRAKCSKEVKDLIKKMLVTEYSKRIIKIMKI